MFYQELLEKISFKSCLKRILFHYLSHFRENLIGFLHLFYDKRLTAFSLF